MSIDIPTVEIALLKERFLKKNLSFKRKINEIRVDMFISENEINFSEKELYYGGIFDIKKGSMFLTDILIDKYDGIDILDHKKCIKVLETKKGIKIQKARFRDNIINPIRRWLRNRGIYNKSFAIAIVNYAHNDELSSLLTYLDENKTYSTIAIGKYEFNKSIS